MSNEILAALIGAFAGIAGTYLTAILKYRKDLEAEYDESLRDQRIKEYLKLWKLTGLLAKYGQFAPVCYKDLQTLTLDLRVWYFENGGMFLSDASRDRYFALQEALKTVLADQHNMLEQAVDPDTYERLRSAGSLLRTSMAADVGTRRKPILAEN